MPVKRFLPRMELQEILEHRDYTLDSLIKCYTLTQLSVMDGIDTRTIKKSPKYLPVRIDDSQNQSKFRRGIYKKPYRVLYIRLDEVKHIFNVKSGKNLVVEYN
jgi:hypothetical protein